MATTTKTMTTPLETLTKVLAGVVDGNVMASRCGVEILIPSTWEADVALVFVAQPHTRGIDVSLRAIDKTHGDTYGATKILWDARTPDPDARDESFQEVLSVLRKVIPQVRDHLATHGLSAPFLYKPAF